MSKNREKGASQTEINSKVNVRRRYFIPPDA